jgi:uncharacterized protein (DUF885 family)
VPEPAGERLGGARDVHEIFARVNGDPAMYFRSGDELLAHAHQLLARTAETLPRWFGHVPKAPLRIEPLPAAEAAANMTAHYRGQSLDGRVPAAYLINTSDTKERSRLDMAATALHEGLPGHHLQLSLVVELGDIPLDRAGNDTAFVEGWALYSEALADEMGLYQDDAERLGRWRNDAWRGARLVVDTGLHAMGWSVERAVTYMKEHAGMSDAIARAEIARYLEWPAQALAYKVGALEIRRLRDEATQRLGDRFDIRAFHDALLGSGSLPLPVATAVVERWIGEHARPVRVAKRL